MPDGYVAGGWRPVDACIETTVFHRLADEAWSGLAEEAKALTAFLADREPIAYHRYAHWWAKLPSAEVRLLPRLGTSHRRSEHEMLRGFATISYWADDLEAARNWYTELLGVEPYFVMPREGPPAYIEFRVGDHQDELGIIDRRYAPAGAAGGPGGAIMHWHVDDVTATFERLLAMGAREYQPITPRGESGWITASVVDPFGNVLGIMYNPHWVEMLSEPKGT